MKLSIITVNLNNADGLRKTIASVVFQTFTDFEYIVIDGGSTDGSVDIIKQYADKITYWVSEQDKGIYNAMNKGILKAKGEYCLFLNSGDYFFSRDSISKLIIENNEDYSIIYGNILVKEKDKDFVKSYPDVLKFSYFLYDTLPHPASLIRKSLLYPDLYNEKFEICSDWEFFILAICKYNCTYKHVNQVISVFYNNGISSNFKKARQEQKDSLNKNFSLFIHDYNELERLNKFEYEIKHSRKIQYLKNKVLKIKNKISKIF